MRRFLDLRVPMSLELLFGMAVVIAGGSVALAYLLVLAVGP